MASELSKQKAAQAWCFNSTKHLEIDLVLAEAFAEILDDVWSKAWLGNATSGEMIEELRARGRTSEIDDSEVDAGTKLISIMIIEDDVSECYLLDADYKTVSDK